VRLYETSKMDWVIGCWNHLGLVYLGPIHSWSSY